MPCFPWVATGSFGKSRWRGGSPCGDCWCTEGNEDGNFDGSVDGINEGKAVVDGRLDGEFEGSLERDGFEDGTFDPVGDVVGSEVLTHFVGSGSNGFDVVPHAP